MWMWSLFQGIPCWSLHMGLCSLVQHVAINQITYPIHVLYPQMEYLCHLNCILIVHCSHNFCILMCHSKTSMIFFSFFTILWIEDSYLRSYQPQHNFFFLSWLSQELPTFHLKAALYGFPSAYLNCQHRYSCPSEPY